MKNLKNPFKNQKDGARWILLSGIFAILFAIAFYFAHSMVFRQVPVLVAKEEMNPGDPIVAEKFEVKKVPIGRLQEDVVRADEKLEGFVCFKGMLAGDILRKGNAVDLQDRNLSVLSTRLAALKEKGLRGIEVPTDSLGGMLSGMTYGDKVSIGVVYKNEDAATQAASQNEFFTPEIIVPEAVVAGLKSEDNKGTLVVAVTEAEWLKFMEASEKGTIHVSLIPFGKAK